MVASESSGLVKRVGLAAALAAVPIGAYSAYRHIQSASDARDRAIEKSFGYDTAQFRQVDPPLVQYRELTRIDPAMPSPRVIATDPQGNLLVGGINVVRKLSPTGQRLGDVAVSGTVHCLAAAGDGTLYVGLKERVEVYDPAGKRLAAWEGFGQRVFLTSIAIGEDGIYVADAGRRVVMRLDRQGNLLGEIGKPDQERGQGGLVVHSAHLEVAVDGEGLVWVANPGKHRIEAYLPDGTLSRYWGEAGTDIGQFFGCCNPADFALLADGSFITAEKSVPRVKHYFADGRFDCVVAPPSEFGEGLSGMDVAVNAQGQVMVLERGTQTVRVFARDGGAR